MLSIEEINTNWWILPIALSFLLKFDFEKLTSIKFNFKEFNMHFTELETPTFEEVTVKKALKAKKHRR